MKKYFPALAVLWLLIGCASDKMGMEEYVKWINEPENGLIQHRTIGQIKVEVMYLPAEFIALNELGSDDSTSKGYAKRVNELKKDHHFKLRFVPVDGKTDFLKVGIRDMSQYYARLQYLTSGFQNDVLLADGPDTTLCALHHFERSFHLTPHGDILLAFSKKVHDSKNQLILIYDDQMFDLGILQFVFPSDVLLNAPKPYLNS